MNFNQTLPNVIILEKTNRECRKCEESDAKANAPYWNQWERMWWRQWRWRWRTKAVAVEYLYIALRVDIVWYIIRTMAKMAMKDKKTVRIAEKLLPPPPPWRGCGVTGLGWFVSIMAYNTSYMIQHVNIFNRRGSTSTTFLQ